MRCVEPMDPTLMRSLLEDFRFVDICFVIIPILPEKKPNTSQGPRKEFLVVSAAFYLVAFFSVLDSKYANPKKFYMYEYEEPQNQCRVVSML